VAVCIAGHSAAAADTRTGTLVVSTPAFPGRKNLATPYLAAIFRISGNFSGNGDGAPGWDRTSNPCLRSFTRAPHFFINQCLAQLANCKTKAKQGHSRPTKSIQTVFSLYFHSPARPWFRSWSGFDSAGIQALRRPKPVPPRLKKMAAPKGAAKIASALIRRWLRRQTTRENARHTA